MNTIINEDYYNIQDYLSKQYPKLTKDSLELMTNTILRLESNKTDFEYLIYALTKELKDIN